MNRRKQGRNRKKMLEGREILNVLRERQREISGRFSVRKIGLFGSVVRGGASEDSDIDILVELHFPSFDNYMDLKFFLKSSSIVR